MKAFVRVSVFILLSRLDVIHGDNDSEGRSAPDIPVRIAVAPAVGPIAVAAAFANQHHFSDCEWPCPYYHWSNHHHPRAALRNHLKTFTKESGLTSDTSLYFEKEHSPHVLGIHPMPHIVGSVPLLYTSDVIHRRAAEKKARRLLLKRRVPDTEQHQASNADTESQRDNL
ncbi:unnamed protein product [Cylicocyclus nassatus]|uniref:Secreted protein n=1 Tax=Cylicocyclus nassatus TaxID=53992 RepID=A0AA36GH84_CYLNA|nr:unnamed protein product [Cylicocyclus nassatus]